VDETGQQRAPFFEALQAFAATGAQMFSTPGHKRGRGAPDEMRVLWPDLLTTDIPHGGGVDTTHRSFGLLRRAERLAAAAYGGDDARFLVNGSTTGNLAMLLATCGDGDTVIVSRMLHKSLLTGLIFSGARPVWVTPAIDPDNDLPLDIDPVTVAQALELHPAARAVTLVSPSYVGIASDLDAISTACHRAGVPLLVDEAWGPHFAFHPALPPSAMQAGADAGVSSTHKMLAAITQGSTLVARAGRIDLQRLHTIVDMVQTTSPSAQIYASLDASRREMALHGRELLDRTLALAQLLRAELATIDGLEVLSDRVIAGRAGAALDPTRVLIDVHKLGLSGQEAEMYLREQHAVHVEMSDLRSVELLITIGDDEQSIDRGVVGFRGLAARRREPPVEAAVRSTGTLLFGAEQLLTPREAFMAEAEVVPLAQAAGRVSAESITPYPPGIPVVTPGECLGQLTIDYLRRGVAAGMHVSGASDPSLGTVRVVR
jgi:lysine decarboxylase